jgi:hypothetical protein
VKIGEVSRARQRLTGAALAPRDESTFHELQSKRPQEAVRALSPEVRDFEPEAALTLDKELFIRSLRAAPRGSAPGPGGCSYDLYRAILDDEDTLDLLWAAAQDFAQAAIPECIADAFMSAYMTALCKESGGVRGIATSTSFRRLVAKTLAKQFGGRIEEACAPFQFALSTRAGTDCVGHVVRAITDADPSATLLSIDGVGAYDHVLRDEMLRGLQRTPQARDMLPFVRLAYARPSKYAWYDDDGNCRFIEQAEGGEQGDPLMPLLFSLGIHDALAYVATQLQDGEHVFAYLDDVYVISQPGRVREVYN